MCAAGSSQAAAAGRQRVLWVELKFTGLKATSSQSVVEGRLVFRRAEDGLHLTDTVTDSNVPKLERTLLGFKWCFCASFDSFSHRLRSPEL